MRLRKLCPVNYFPQAHLQALPGCGRIPRRGSISRTGRCLEFGERFNLGALVIVTTTPIRKSRNRAYSCDDASRFERLASKIVVLGLCVFLAFAVLAFGSVEYWAICVLEVGAAVLIVLWAMTEALSRDVTIRVSLLYVPLALLGLLLAAQALLPHTVYWYATWTKMLQWSSYAILFFVATQVFRFSASFRLFGIFFALFGIAVAVFALAQEGAGNGKLYWIFADKTFAASYGPYVDHAHYAGLMEMLIPIPLILGWSRLFGRTARWILVSAAVIMASSLFLSRSLGGIIAFVGEIFVLFILLFRERGFSALRSMILLIVGLSTAIILLQPSQLQQRLSEAMEAPGRADAGIRVMIARDSLRMIRERPILGYGAGTFPEAFPAFMSFPTNLTINAAHNDYIQMFVETGVVGLVLLLAFIVLLYWEGIRSFGDWRHDIRGSMALAAVVGCSGLLLHSFSDFNLQVPANAALFFVLAAVAVAPRCKTIKL